MSLQDFANNIPNLVSWSHVEKIKLFAWYLHTKARQERFNQANIRECYDALNLEKPSNVSPYLEQLGKSKPKQVLRDSQGFYLEKRIRDELQIKYGQRSTTNQIHDLLIELPNKIPDLAERAFLDEAIICLRYNAPRAAIVMSWNLAFSHLRDFIVAKHLSAFNAEWPIKFPKKHANSSIKIIGKSDDFVEFKESEVLEICKSAHIISPDTYRVLKEKLDRRNMAAHPNSAVFTPLQAEDFISDLVNNVVLQLK